jgi:hypothetical protein
VIALLDEESSRPAGTDAALLAGLHSAHGKHPYYAYSKPTQLTSFAILHYAGQARPLRRPAPPACAGSLPPSHEMRALR